MIEGATAVTIFYDKDLEFMELQARSFARYVPEGVFGRIILINNSPRRTRSAAWKGLVKLYGPHRHLVEVVDARDVYAMPAMDGWMAQQVLKLAISLQVKTDLYVLLDAKNHFVGPIDRDFFCHADGLPYLDSDNYVDHPLQDFLVRSLALFDLSSKEYIKCFYQTITPFVMYTSVVRAMIAEMERQEGRSFAEVMRDRLVTEFFTYEAFICKTYGTVEKHYHVRPIPPGSVKDVVWPETNGYDDIHEIIDHIDRTGHKIFSFHRRAGRGLTSQSRDLLAGFWIRRGLLDNRRQARSFFARQRYKLMSESASNIGMRVVRKIRVLAARAGGGAGQRS
ncbi:MAG: DUF6492 family protein [Alsobacter sp.]